MAIQELVAVLQAAQPVQALAAKRISPVIKSQALALPAVTLQRSAVNPVNSLTGHCDLDENQIQVDSWAETYAAARALADACRAAIQAAGHVMNSEFDNYEPSVEPGVYCITQSYSVWL